MEGQVEDNTGVNKAIIPTVIVALIVFAAIGFYLSKSNNNPQGVTSKTPNITEQASPTGSATAIEQGNYKDGTYSVVGNYVSPGGPRELNVTITLADGVISAAETVGTATDATSMRFQGEFVGSFKPQVVGKNIDEVSLTKVAGSSLSPKGFNDAIAKVKAEAQS